MISGGLGLELQAEGGCCCELSDLIEGGVGDQVDIGVEAGTVGDDDDVGVIQVSLSLNNCHNFILEMVYSIIIIRILCLVLQVNRFFVSIADLFPFSSLTQQHCFLSLILYEF